MADRDLNPEQNERLRALMRDLVRRFGGQTALAEKLGRSQSTLSGFMGGRQGGSFALVHAVAELAGVDPATILTGAPEAAEPVVERPWRDPKLPELVRAGRLSEEAARWINDELKFAGGHRQEAESYIAAGRMLDAARGLVVIPPSEDDEPPMKRRKKP